MLYYKKKDLYQSINYKWCAHLCNEDPCCPPSFSPKLFIYLFLLEFYWLFVSHLNMKKDLTSFILVLFFVSQKPGILKKESVDFLYPL